MAEITRHRLASFCIESQRYVCMDGEISFVHPLCCETDAKVDKYWRSCMRRAREDYHYLLSTGCRPQGPRKVLTNSPAPCIVMKANLRQWRHVLSLRTSKGVYPEKRQ